MIVLTGHSLTIAEARRVIYDREPVAAALESMEAVRKSRAAVEQAIASGRTIYGVNTGFGKLADVRIDGSDLEQLQINLLRSHACAVGEPFAEEVVRAMLLLRANALLKGYSGIRPVVIERLLAFLNSGIHPIVPQQGSLGASGDLAPLAHLALALVGEGEVMYQGQRMPAIQALSQAGIPPLSLKEKEGLALINGTQAMTAMGVIAYLEAEQLAYDSEWIAALTIEALYGVIDAFDARIHEARGFLEQAEVAERLRRYLDGSQLITRQGERRVQDAYSIRCIPQVHGASLRALRYVKETLEIEMNAATDNPLIFADGAVLSGGNFHGQPVAIAMDLLKIAVAELANMSERRIERLVNPQLSEGLPPFLSPEPGLQSGAMIMQYVAASLVSENKTLAHPASVDSIPSSANQEDHVSMGTTAARHAYLIVQNVRKVLAIELICALQAVEERGIDQLAPSTSQLYHQARRIVPSIVADRVFSRDIEAVDAWLKQQAIRDRLAGGASV
ncbi:MULTISPECIES: histidine ammonia-lyase [Geobacillus]|jgi:histidine ammonia-lyase|uniref:Histidine ammonia-lyase n=3 Tax=Geobacillus thermodenitrificans TaxID=33940 RepID=HUTH_GEOTN|nr:MULTISPECIES: histidine ammonia-lyase [Geobacillus]A4IK90.1 RecName: Full=Histidine ammonia-lyase; Short=Histidase [Geobacillus thermodenitrificans NG80-2]ABO65744.1 Histidase [Geobacillus thermodenitrificans NG80-2]ARA97806.1 histidine ammonia-lyase [Geobacillus thermodenitrificans]ARP41436.1 Histidine ammonia-lyase [Geobacillus thermodenitrificans]KQB94634.1 Histidine ammonia-lyase [Geobacillus sp. PA-3]MEC5189187.1 histidine ammonia-lyase [Geobacillus thermodenitrificans]